jgi:hypothetical protein
LSEERVTNRFIVLSLYINVTGKRGVQLGFYISQGTQYFGFHHIINMRFDIKPAVKVTSNSKDYDDTLLMASLIISTGIERVIADGDTNKIFSGWAPSKYKSGFDGWMFVYKCAIYNT